MVGFGHGHVIRPARSHSSVTWPVGCAPSWAPGLHRGRPAARPTRPVRPASPLPPRTPMAPSGPLQSRSQRSYRALCSPCSHSPRSPRARHLPGHSPQHPPGRSCSRGPVMAGALAQVLGTGVRGTAGAPPGTQQPGPERRQLRGRGGSGGRGSFLT